MTNKLLFSFLIFLTFITGCSVNEDEPQEDSGPQFSTFTDPRDGKIYNTANICGKVWFAENLNYEGIPLAQTKDQWCDLTDDRMPIRTRYKQGNDPSGGCTSCEFQFDRYGAYYNWYAIIREDLCPNGWHVATKDDWEELAQCYPDSTNFYLMDTVGFRYISSLLVNGELPSITNSSGLSLLPVANVGFRCVSQNLVYNPINDSEQYSGGNYWTSTPIGGVIDSSANGVVGNYIMYFYILDNNVYSLPFVSGTKIGERSMPCRCVKD